MMFRAATVFSCILATLLVSTLAPSAPVSADDVSVVIEPARGPVGTTVYIRVTGLVGDEEVTVAFNDEDNIVAVARPDDYGDCTTSFTAGNYPAGDYRVWVDYETNEDHVYFTVEPSVNLNKSSVNVGDNALVSGRGFAAGEPVTVYFDDTIVLSEVIETNENGAFPKVALTIPEAGKGSHVVSVKDGQGNSACDSIIVKQAVTMLPASGTPGSEVSISGNGFLADSSIVVYFDGEDVGGTIASDNGSFNTSFLVPLCSTGTYKVKVSDGSNLSYQDFTVTAGLFIKPAVGGIGVHLTVEGTGFRSGLPVVLRYDGDIVKTVNADVQGDFSTTFKVPPGSSGEHEVIATDGASTGSTIFTVESEPPAVPVLILPENEAGIASRAYFDWKSVSDMSGVTYDLVIASDASFSSVVLTRENLVDSEYTLDNEDNLPPGGSSPYYWRVRAVDLASNAGDWSPPGIFYVISSPPGLMSPPDGAVISDEINFDWGKDDEDGDATCTLEIAADSGFTNILLSKQGLTTSEYTLSIEEELPANQGRPYYWRVKTTGNASDSGQCSVVRTFYVVSPEPPPVPSVLSPPDETEVSHDVHFIWYSSGGSDRLTYSLEVASDAGFTEIILAREKLIKPEYVLSSDEGLSPGKTYYWRVRTIESPANGGDWSDTGSFCVADNMPDWVKYSLAGLVVVLLCFLSYCFGRMKAFYLSGEE
ncbi:MAG: hypothetical protein PVG61_05005 [Dehalococcoidia bacterium]|jgi:hypothetical protein